MKHEHGNTTTLKHPRRLLLTLLVVLSTTAAHAQWLTFDASNLAQSIVNSTNEVFETATTASHMLNNFKETVKIYEQGKKYFDALRSVNNLVRDARKVQQCVLMVGEMSDIYVNNFRKMLADSNFSAEELTAIPHGIFDMAPDLEHYLRFVAQNGVGHLYVTPHNRRIVQLLHIREHGRLLPELFVPAD